MNLQTTFGIDHPVAMITGSTADRVGRVIAKRLAAAGCHLVLHGHHRSDDDQSVADSLRKQHAIDVTIIHGDVTESDAPARWIDHTIAHHGRIDILVNSAAIWSPTPLADVTAEEIRRYFDVNTIAPWMLSRSAAGAMSSNPLGGAIVNLGDWATCRPYIDHAAYFPSKSAIEGMTRSLAVELSRLHRAIRVNCVRPGPVLLADDVDAQTADQLAAATLVGRVGTPAAIAHAVEFLCVNDFTTGACLTVDGGRSIFAPDGLQIGRNTG